METRNWSFKNVTAVGFYDYINARERVVRIWVLLKQKELLWSTLKREPRKRNDIQKYFIGFVWNTARLLKLMILENSNRHPLTRSIFKK